MKVSKFIKELGEDILAGLLIGLPLIALGVLIIRIGGTHHIVTAVGLAVMVIGLFFAGSFVW